MSHLFTIREVCETLGVGPEHIRSFVEREWILPAGCECRSGEEDSPDAAAAGGAGEHAGEHYLDDTDVARARLILELRNVFGANDESIPVILHLIDQIHALRERLQHVRVHPVGRA